MSQYQIIQTQPLPSNCRIAGFDLDYTIIKPKSGKKFPKDRDDWEFLYPKEQLLTKLNTIAVTHQIVFFTNQKKYNEDWVYKIQQILSQLQLPIPVYVGIQSGYYRKPFTGLWDLLASQTKIDLKRSFYCGDAAGRPQDFAATDRMFAHNIGVRHFFTPEQLLPPTTLPLVKYKPNIDILTPFLIDSDSEKTQEEREGVSLQLCLDSLNSFGLNKENKKVMVLTLGYPGSGKSTITNILHTHFNYQIVNRDTLKTKAKCLKLTTVYLKENKNIVIDATNYTRDMRAEYLKLALPHDYQIILIHVDNSIEVSYYMNQYRCQTSHGSHGLIPKVVYYKMRKNLEIPTLEEGIHQIYSITNFLAIDPYQYQFETI